MHAVSGSAQFRRDWAHLDLSARTAAYDNNAAVAESAELIRRRDERAAAYRMRDDAHLDIRYGSSERRAWDLFPGARADSPCLVFIHGGYWQRNSRRQFAHLAGGITHHGWAFATMGYSLAPDHRLGEIVDDTRDALDWLDAHGGGYGIGGPLVVAGWSAGATLAALALDHPTVTGGIAISGIYDLAPLSQTSIGAALDLSASDIAELSPLRITPAAKPLVIAYAERELSALAMDSLDLHAHRNAHGAPSTLFALPDCDHFTILDALERPDGALTRSALGLRLGV